jgi:hypothetical protein
MQCPDQFDRVAELLEYNSLFGMQFMKHNHRFVPCLCNKAMELCDQIKTLSGCHTLEADDFIGHEYLTVAWYEYDKIPDLYNALIDAHISFTIKYNHVFHGYDDMCERSFTYTPENMEKKFVASMDQLLNKTDRFERYVVEYELQHNCRIFDPWNYITPEGIDFCERMCRRCSRPLKPMDHEENYKLWSWYRPLSDLITETEVVSQVSNNDKFMQQFVPDETECMICYSATPNTKVMPCGHVVVCDKCSRALGGTADHSTCVRCRRPIEFVAYASGEVQSM